MASVVKRRAVLEPSKLNRDSQKAGVTMVRVVLSALVYAGQEPKSVPARDLGDCRS